MPGISSSKPASSTRRSRPHSGEVSTSPRVLGTMGAPPEPSRAAQRTAPRNRLQGSARKTSSGEIEHQSSLRVSMPPRRPERLAARHATLMPPAETPARMGISSSGRSAAMPAQDADLIRAASAATGEEHGQRAAVAGRHQQRIVVDAAHARRAMRLTIEPCPILAISSSSAADRAGTSRPSAPRSSASPSRWSRRTRSWAAPACTAAASRPRRCSTPPTCSKRHAAARSSASPAPSRSSTSPRRTSTSRRWCARTRRGSSRCSARTTSRWCTGKEDSTARAGWWSRGTAASAP